MKPTALLALIGLAGLTSSAATGQGATSDFRVSPQGILHTGLGDSSRVSPRGSARMEVIPLGGDHHHLQFSLLVTARDGSVHRIPRVTGNGFLMSDLDRIVAIDAHESNAFPTRLTVLDLGGQALFESRIDVLTDPALSNDGRYLAFRDRAGVVVLDLASFEEVRHPHLEMFAAGPGGILAGVRNGGSEIVVRSPRGFEITAPSEERPRRLAFSEVEPALLFITSHALVRMDLPSAGLETLHSVRDDLRDMRVTPEGITLGVRRVVGDEAAGSRFDLDWIGRLRGSGNGPVMSPMQVPIPPLPVGTIPWPLSPNVQRAVGNTYAEYQNYGGSPYMHPGVDIFGSDNQPVYASESGQVKAVLTTSGQYHWRVATSATGSSGTSRGYLYAHLKESTIAVNVGDWIAEGDYLGDLVPWPVNGFTHTHFNQVEDSGSQWFGDWLCTENSHLRLYPQTETQKPVFENAVGSNLFAFCNNQSSSYQNPQNLKGKVDIIAHVSDAIVQTTWRCSVQEIRYTIYPQGSPDSPVVDDKLAVYFDMELDTYQNGTFDSFLVDLLYKQDSTCDTEGDYDSREFFHIITNSDGDQDYETSDLAEAWDTTAVPDGKYVVEVTARDVAGNSTTAAMTVTVNN